MKFSESIKNYAFKILRNSFHKQLEQLDGKELIGKGPRLHEQGTILTRLPGLRWAAESLPIVWGIKEFIIIYELIFKLSRRTTGSDFGLWGTQGSCSPAPHPKNPRTGHHTFVVRVAEAVTRDFIIITVLRPQAQSFSFAFGGVIRTRPCVSIPMATAIWER